MMKQNVNSSREMIPIPYFIEGFILLGADGYGVHVPIYDDSCTIPSFYLDLHFILVLL